MPSFLPESLDFYSHSVRYVSASAIVLLVAGIVNANVLWSGICRAIRFRFSAEGVAFVCFLVSGLYDLYFLFIGLYPHSEDMQFYCDTVWVLEKLGIPLNNYYMIHLNAEYVRGKELDPSELFVVSNAFVIVIF